MKKILFLASLAAVAMTSCTSESNEYVGGNDNTPKEIAFFPVNQKATRGADYQSYAVTGTTFPTGLNMYVAAYDANKGTSGGDYFAKTQFANSTSTLWTGGKYWPFAECWLNFLAVANVSSGSAVTMSDASGATVTLADNSSNQYDLMYAIGHGEVTLSGNTLSYTNATAAMEFKHAQSWLNFKVKASVAGITITGITVHGGVYEGSAGVTFTNYNYKYTDGTNTQSVAVAWTVNSANAKDASVHMASNHAVSNTTFQPVGSGIIMVPRVDAFTGFTINYTTSDGKAYSYTYTFADATEMPDFVAGTQYIYNVMFNMHEIQINATVADWDTTTSNINTEGSPKEIG